MIDLRDTLFKKTYYLTDKKLSDMFNLFCTHICVFFKRNFCIFYHIKKLIYFSKIKK